MRMISTPNLRNILIGTCLIITVLMMGILIYGFFFQEGNSFSIDVYKVTPMKASEGNIINLTDEDLKGSPELARILQRDLSSTTPLQGDDRFLGGAKVSEEDYIFYRNRYPSLSNLNGTQIGNYYQYKNVFFYMEFSRGDVKINY